MVSQSLLTRLERLVKAVLLVTLVLSLAGAGYVAVEKPKSGDPYTEFYVLGTDGNASDYPTDLAAGEAGSVVVGITNREGRDLTYSVVFELNGTAVTSDAITVGEGETRERLMSFSPAEPGRYRLSIDLYKGPSADAGEDPYRTLWLWIDVSEG